MAPKGGGKLLPLFFPYHFHLPAFSPEMKNRLLALKEDGDENA